MSGARIRTIYAGGGAATVAGHDGPGFHNYPSCHIPRDADGKDAVRIRSPAKNSFGEAFGEVTYGVLDSVRRVGVFLRVGGGRV